MLRVVLDTNVFVSSLLVKSGLSVQAITAWRERHFLLVTSPTLISEIIHTLGYERIRRKYHVTDEDVVQLVDLLEREALVVPGDVPVSGAIPDDPDDEKVLACALEGQADLIVSGDQHLLALGVFQGIAIITVRELLERLAREYSVIQKVKRAAKSE